ncbi:MAG: hypothetical protein JSV91_08825 [Phycisphaerales bacterium]|nr:MAG: hypothetical protein JSV91_08825 [Phycisphaerales bacterium]
MISRQLIVGGAILVSVVYGAVENAQAVDECYWRKDRPKRGESPPGNGWNPGGPNGETLVHYDTIFIGVENGFLDKEVEKSLTVVIKGEGAEDLRIRWGEGYYELNGKSKTSTAKDREGKPSEGPEDEMTFTMTFDPQPEWEWIQLGYTGEKKDVTFEVTATSTCTWTGDKAGPAEELHLYGVFGFPGSVQGEMHITEIDIFPVNGTVNTSVNPWFFGPGAGRAWSWGFIYTDPDGGARPQGGVQFSTDAEGLKPGDFYEFTFEMNEEADLEYAYYAFDNDAAEYQRYDLNVSPKVTEWRTVQHHVGVADFGIDLAPEAVGNGWDGPISETRVTGITRIEADFAETVVLLDPTAVMVTDGVNSYTPDSVNLVNGNQVLQILFNPGVLPDMTCYTVDIAGAIKDLQTDSDCMIRGLVADVDFNGVVNQADVDLITSLVGQPVDATTAFADITADGMIDSNDVSTATLYVGNAAICDGCGEYVGWYDGFTDYDVGSQMDGQGGWFGWDMNPAAGALVSNAQELSVPNSVDIAGASDLVHEFCGADSGKWVFSAWSYVPGDFQSGGSGDTAGSYLILLSHYDWVSPGTDSAWSAQLHADSFTDSFRRDGDNPSSLPLIKDAWVEVRVVIELDADFYRVFYDDVELGVAESWSAGVYGTGGFLNIAAVDMFANESTSVYWDDFRLVSSCPADVNDDEVVDIDDLFDILAHWGEGAGPYDVNGDGTVDIDDIFGVLAGWGPCP